MRSPALPVPRLPENACLLLDFDGTLIEFAATPAAIRVPPALLSLLDALRTTLDGALAIVTGRALEDIDHHLAPLQLPAAALHGMVRRDGEGRVSCTSSAASFAAQAARIRQRLLAWVTAFPGLLLEDKGLALALHFRGYQGNAAQLHALMSELRSLLSPDMELLQGELVVEVRPRGSDKGTAVEAFLAEAPFKGRVPVYLGDDLGDLPAMTAVKSYGGMAIAVGERIAAPWQLRTPADARTWLGEVLAERLVKSRSDSSDDRFAGRQQQ